MLFLQAALAIRLLVCGDDSGAAHSINEGTLQAFDNGIERCANVIVPGPWFNDIARRLRDRPGLGVGVHLTLTSEWDAVKWRPITGGRTLVDAEGYFPATTKGFLANKPDLGEVERELRAQIERAKREIKQVGWMLPHMGTAVATPELRALTQRLAEEYGLPLLGSNPGFKGLRHPKPEELKSFLEKLEPGNYYMIEHASVDTPEARALGHAGYTDVAAQRAAILRAWTDEGVKEVIRKRGIVLMSPEDVKAAFKQ